MSAAQLVREIKAGKLASSYFLAGEGYECDRVLQAVRQLVIGEGSAVEGSLSVESFRAGEDRPEAVLAALRTVPMFCQKRLVLVRDCQQWKAEDLDQLLPVIEKPSPETCLVMVAERADARLKFFGRIKKHGVFAKFEPLKDRAVATWVAEEAQQRHVRLEPGVAQRIAEAVGTDRGQLAAALERLELYTGRAEIPVAAVEDLLVQTRKRSIFELTNAVGRGQRRQALEQITQLLAGHEPALRIVAMLSRHLRQLWVAKELSQARRSQTEIAQVAGLHPYFVRDLVSQAQRFEASKLRRIHSLLSDTDRKLKASGARAELVMNRLVMELCPAS